MSGGPADASASRHIGWCSFACTLSGGGLMVLRGTVGGGGLWGFGCWHRGLTGTGTLVGHGNWSIFGVEASAMLRFVGFVCGQTKMFSVSSVLPPVVLDHIEPWCRVMFKDRCWLPGFCARERCHSHWITRMERR